jgi:hypothetical protein
VGGERMYAIEEILGRLSRLSNEVADAADFVPAYDHRAYSEMVKVLRDQLTEAQAKVSPRSRFQFKQRGADSPAAAKPDTRRLNPGMDNNSNNQPADLPVRPATIKDASTNIPTATTTTSTSTQTDNNTAITNPSAGKPSNFQRDLTLNDHSRVHITLPATASRAISAWTLTSLDRCVVDMSAPTTSSDAANPPFASMALKDIAGSVIVAGHVDGPVHVTNVKDSVVMVAARQVRIHDCENVVFYLHCVSRPIIEGCKGVRFGKAPGCYVSFSFLSSTVKRYGC